MLCPNCGSDNPSYRAACAVCGADLSLSGVETFDAPAVNGNERADFEDSLWPPPAVFVLEEDEENVLDLPASVAQFEDAQADDVFEQSLSGVRLEDLVNDEEEIGLAEPEAEIEPEPESEPDSMPEPEPEPEPSLEPFQYAAERPRNEAVGSAPAGPLLDGTTSPEPRLSVPAMPSMFQVIERQTLTPEPIVESRLPDPIALPLEEPRRNSRTPLWLLMGAIALIAAFGAGAGTGFWYAAQKIPRSQPVSELPPPNPDKPAAPDAPEGMVYVPGGDFLMGSDTGEELSRPAHFVSVRPFFIDRTEVTNAAYRDFVVATGYDAPPTWKDGAVTNGEEELPVTGITWYDAAAFAAWTGKRLPTEAEWEFAARGSDGRKYPWGNEWEPALANVDNISKGLRRVGEGEPTPLGIFDMAGNAWEWTASDARSYPGGTDFPRSRLRLKIIRGGNFKSSSESASSIFRGFYGASGEKDYSSTSFRCVKDISD